MLVIHPGYPKTGTTFLQHLIRHEDWYVGAQKEDAVSTRLSAAARSATTADALSEEVRDLAGRRRDGKTLFLSEEAVLSLRPYEIAYKIGLYTSIGDRIVTDGAWHEPTYKLRQIAGAVKGVERAWLLTVRRHHDWCQSYYRYTLSELGPRRGAVYLAALAAAQTVGGPLYGPTIHLIQALDPDAPLVVVPMEALIDPAHQEASMRFFADRFGLRVPLTSGATAVNASATPLPYFYTRFVRSMTHIPLPGPLRRAGRLAERTVRSRLAGRTGYVTPAALVSEFDRLSGAFRSDAAVLQAYSPFNLESFGYGQ